MENNLHGAIVAELYRVLETLGADPRLLATVNSWGDGLTDEQVLEQLKMWNEEGGIRFDPPPH